MASVEMLQARVATLEDELRASRAEAERLALEAQQASQYQEQRYETLLQELQSLTSERDKLATERAEQAEAASQARSEVASLQVDKAEVERAHELAMRERDEAVGLNKRLEKLLEQRRTELTERDRATDQHLQRVHALTTEKAQIEEAMRAAQGKASEADARACRVEQERALFEKHNKWLEDELSAKNESIMKLRKESAAEIQQLRAAQSDLESDKARLTQDNAQLRHKLEAAQKAADAAESQLRRLREQVAEREEHFAKELSVAERLAEIGKEDGRDLRAKLKERESTIEGLKESIRRMEAASKQQLEHQKVVASEANSEVSRLREQLNSLMSGAGMSPLPGGATPGTAPRTPGSALRGSPGGVPATWASLSDFEKFEAAQALEERYRRESRERRRIEQLMNEVIESFEHKVPQMAEQRRVLQELRERNARLTEQLQVAQAERRASEAQRAQLGEQARIAAKRSEDLSRQVERLTMRVTTLQGGRAALPAREALAAAAADPDVLTAEEVISERLVEFEDVAHLHRINAHLLTVARQLSEQCEATRASVEASLRDQHQQELEAVRVELEQLRRSREEQERLVKQIVNQRDLFKSMLTSAVGGDRGADAASVAVLANYRPEDAGARGGAQGGGGGGAGASGAAERAGDGVDYKALYGDKERELQMVQEESARNVSMLKVELGSARDQATAAVRQAEQARAAEQFERSRVDRLQEQTAGLRQQLALAEARVSEQMQHNLKMEATLKELNARVEAAEAASRSDRQRAATLEARIEVVQASEQRHAQEASGLLEAKHRLAAELEAASKVHASQLGDARDDRVRLQAEVARLQQEWGQASKELAEQRSRADSELSKLQLELSRAENKADQAQADASRARKDLQDADARARKAESTAQVLQDKLLAAEKRAAGLQMRVESLASASLAYGAAGGEAPAGAGAGGGELEAELRSQMARLRAELEAAQEAAAAAQGNAKQYQALAASADEALRRVEADRGRAASVHAAALASADQRNAQATRELEQAREDLGELRRRLTEVQGELEAARAEAASGNGALKKEVAELSAARARAEEQLAAVRKDADQHFAQWRASKQSYDLEVVQHAQDIQKLAQLEEQAAAVEARAREARAELDRVLAERDELRTERARAAAAAEEAAGAHARREAELKARIEGMAQELEAAAARGGAASGESGHGEASQVVHYLRREKERVEAELSLAQQQRARLEQQVRALRQEVAELRALQADAAERERRAAEDSEAHQRVVAQAEQLNLLRESNNALRAESTKSAEQLAALRGRVAELERQREPLRRELASLRARGEAHAEELRVAREDAGRWEARANQLLSRTGKVDKAEHDRVCADLEAARKRVAELQALRSGAAEELEKELKKKNEAYGKMRDMIVGIAKAIKVPVKKMQTAEWQEEYVASAGAAARERELQGKVEEAERRAAEAGGKVTEAQKEAQAARAAAARMQAAQQRMQQQLQQLQAAQQQGAQPDQPAAAPARPDKRPREEPGAEEEAPPATAAEEGDRAAAEPAAKRAKPDETPGDEPAADTPMQEPERPAETEPQQAQAQAEPTPQEGPSQSGEAPAGAAEEQQPAAEQQEAGEAPGEEKQPAAAAEEAPAAEMELKAQGASAGAQAIQKAFRDQLAQAATTTPRAEGSEAAGAAASRPAAKPPKPIEWRPDVRANIVGRFAPDAEGAPAAAEGAAAAAPQPQASPQDPVAAPRRPRAGLRRRRDLPPPSTSTAQSLNHDSMGDLPRDVRHWRASLDAQRAGPKAEQQYLVGTQPPSTSVSADGTVDNSYGTLLPGPAIAGPRPAASVPQLMVHPVDEGALWGRDGLRRAPTSQQDRTTPAKEAMAALGIVPQPGWTVAPGPAAPVMRHGKTCVGCGAALPSVQDFSLCTKCHSMLVPLSEVGGRPVQQPPTPVSVPPPVVIDTQVHLVAKQAGNGNPYRPARKRRTRRKQRPQAAASDAQGSDTRQPSLQSAPGDPGRVVDPRAPATNSRHISASGASASPLPRSSLERRGSATNALFADYPPAWARGSESSTTSPPPLHAAASMPPGSRAPGPHMTAYGPGAAALGLAGQAGQPVGGPQPSQQEELLRMMLSAALDLDSD
ncbi:unnamed protein product [Pedinophyceae sp. YPF-701]|nr:unnamed protein product [Pedinophyceae sp. YPF-701]